MGEPEWMIPRPASYSWYRFPAEIISHAGWPYRVFSLSLRDVELILAEHGITVTHESIRHAWLRYWAAWPYAALSFMTIGGRWPSRTAQRNRCFIARRAGYGGTDGATFLVDARVNRRGQA